MRPSATVSLYTTWNARVLIYTLSRYRGAFCFVKELYYYNNPPSLCACLFINNCINNALAINLLIFEKIKKNNTIFVYIYRWRIFTFVNVLQERRSRAGLQIIRESLDARRSRPNESSPAEHWMRRPAAFLSDRFPYRTVN